jgi:hypothetical protein
MRPTRFRLNYCLTCEDFELETLRTACRGPVARTETTWSAAVAFARRSYSNKELERDAEST